jgi:hypothetical protein
MTTQTFDCVEMMHGGARRIHEATRSLSRKAELAYWQAKERELLPPVPTATQRPTVVRESRTPYRTTR